MTAGDTLRWMAHAPAERATVPASGVLWTAAEVMHAAGVSGVDVGLVSFAFTGLTYGALAHRGDRRHGRHAAAAMTAIGAWMTTATIAGPLGTWHDALTWVWGIGTLAGYWALNRHEGVRAARQWRRAKANWLQVAPWYGLYHSHLLSWERTRLGEAMIVDVTGTGRRASAFVTGDLAERIAEREKLPLTRVKVSKGDIAGRIRISIRRADPWKHPIPHPLLDNDPDIQLPIPCSIREPLIVGQDPETGRPMKLALWDREGAKNVYVIGIKGAGKTTLLDCIRERVTAAGDALLFDINLSKALEDMEWAPACDLTAIGRDERKRALAILRLARRAYEYRSLQPRDTSEFQPSPEQPLIVVMIDEIDAVVKGGDYLAAAIKEELEFLTSKGRSEAIAVILAGQRGTAEWAGGSNIRSQMDVFAVGKVNRRGEMHHAAGDMGLTMPDMASYGEGHAGVWILAELGGGYEIGRVFNLHEPPDLRRLAADREFTQPHLEPGLVAHLGDLYAQLKAGHGHGHRRRPGGAATPPRRGPQPVPADKPPATTVAVLDRPDGLDALDQELEDTLPQDLRDQLRRMTTRAAETRQLLGETETMDLPDVPADQLAAARQERWNQVANAGDIPPDARARLMVLLAGRTTIRTAAADLQVSAWTVRRYLERLRADGVARIEGAGRGARWCLTTPPPEVTDGDDTHDG